MKGEPTGRALGTLFFRYRQPLLMAGFTAIFTGYLTVWLPGPAAGLSFLGVELGEWIKFMGVGVSRNAFYLPPVTLALMMTFWTVTWPNDRWQTWALRCLAVTVSLLAFPAVEAIRSEPGSEWLLRLQLIGLVLVVTLLVGLIGRWVQLVRWSWVLLALLALSGAVVPLWVYLTVRPLVSQMIGLPVGIGPGLWLNEIGHLVVLLVGLQKVRWLYGEGE